MPARPTVSKLVTASVTPLLREHGFQRATLTFDRRRGETTQIVNVQISHGGEVFYVNVGWILHEVRALKASTTGLSVIGKHVIHHGGRLETFAPALPASWRVDERAAGDAIRAGLERVLPLLDRVDCARAMLAEVDLDGGFDKVLRAQLAWITGDLPRAHADLHAVAREFADRQGTSFAQLARRAGIPTG